MKKNLLALAGLVCVAQGAFAQAVEEVAVSEQEVVYVEDNTQGLLINNAGSNWFITAQGGANVVFTPDDSKRDFINRIQPAASIYVGKWFTPVVGLRLGVDWIQEKSLTAEPFGAGVNAADMVDGYYTDKVMHIGPTFDAMINLTNWWCGYNPKRVYNATVYAGAGMYWTLARKYNADGSNATGYKDADNRTLTGRVGLINSFRVSDHVQLFLDLRLSNTDKVINENRSNFIAQAFLGFNYNFGKTTWSAPVVPVCPPAENCDAYRAALAAAEAKAEQLEVQLRGCLNAPRQTEEVVVEDPTICTVYFPIGSSRVSREDARVLGAVANIIKDNPDNNYVVTGWADNYTGTDRINNNLRTQRAENVAKVLFRNGVNKSQVTTTTNNENLYGNNKKYMVLDRAATIDVAK